MTFGHDVFQRGFSAEVLFHAPAEDDEDNDDIECKTSDCPPNHIAVKTTDADGNSTCSCQSTVAIGEGLGAIGRGIGILAIGSIAVTGIVIYGLYRIIRG
jgi:hypothetical protein